MNIDEGTIGMKVYFGRGKGEQTLGEIVKVNLKKFKVKQLEARGTRKSHSIGTIWTVPPALCTPADASAEPTPPKVLGENKFGHTVVDVTDFLRDKLTDMVDNKPDLTGMMNTTPSVCPDTGRGWVVKDYMKADNSLDIINNGSACDAGCRAVSLDRNYHESRKLPPKRYTREQLSPFDTCTCPPNCKPYCEYGWLPDNHKAAAEHLKKIRGENPMFALADIQNAIDIITGDDGMRGEQVVELLQSMRRSGEI